jgi:hypothetical protein
MIPTLWGVVREGRIELEEQFPLAEGARVLVTAVPSEEESSYWQSASQSALDAIWDNPQDEVYAELLKK